MQAPSIVGLYQDVGAPQVSHLSCEDQPVQQGCVPLLLLYFAHPFFFCFLAPFFFLILFFFSACCRYFPADSRHGVSNTCHLHRLLRVLTGGGMYLITCAGIYDTYWSVYKTLWRVWRLPLHLGPYIVLLLCLQMQYLKLIITVLLEYGG